MINGLCEVLVNAGIPFTGIEAVNAHLVVYESMLEYLVFLRQLKRYNKVQFLA